MASPFLHGSWGHLIGNTLPFVVMGCAVALKGAARVLAVTVIVGLVAGLGTWLVSPDNTITVGASGIVFGYATYLLCQGFFDREFLGIADRPRSSPRSGEPRSSRASRHSPACRGRATSSAPSAVSSRRRPCGGNVTASPSRHGRFQL